MVCPKCGKQIMENANFCRNCGALLPMGTGNAGSGQEKGKRKGIFRQLAILLAGIAVLVLAAFGGFYGYRMLWGGGEGAFLAKNEERDEKEQDPAGESQDKQEEGSQDIGKEEEEGQDGTQEDGTQGDGIQEEGIQEDGIQEDGHEEESAPALAAAWQQDGSRWYYYDNQGNMVKNAWVGDYFVGTDGVMQVNTLTADGYWLDETGLASEGMRIYGECLFEPTRYQKNEDGFVITGNICDTGYASEEYMRSLKVGDIVMRPADGAYGRACVFDTESVITGVTDYQNQSYDVNGEPLYPDAPIEHLIYTQSTDSQDDGYGPVYYTLGSRWMQGWQESSMEWPLYRIIKKDVTLAADEDTMFLPAKAEWDDNYEPYSLEDYLEREWRGVAKIRASNGHIDSLEDLYENYVG